METPFSPLSFGKSFMKICSAVPENDCLILMHYHCGGQKKKQKTKKNICKTYTHSRPLEARMRKTVKHKPTVVVAGAAAAVIAAAAAADINETFNSSATSCTERVH